MRDCVVLACSSITVSAFACAVPDPGPGDTLPATPPTLAPPLSFDYRTGSAVSDPSQFSDSDLVEIYLPDHTGSDVGMLLWVHGGGWVGGTRADIPAWVGQFDQLRQTLPHGG